MFVGDVSLGEYYPSFGHGPLSFAENNNVFKNVQTIFDKADIVVGNLEAAITTVNLNPNEPESLVLRGKPDAAKQLNSAGFKILQIANNHTVQHGSSGFTETINILKNENISTVGLNNADIVQLDIDDQTVGFLAASDVPDNTNKQQNEYQRLDEEFIVKVEQSVHKVDHLFVLLHWGLEASTSPLPYQRNLVERLKNSGVRGVIGSHPHLFYEVESSDNFVSAYSLGNFVFDLCWDSRLSKSGILDITLDNNKLECKVWPVTLQKNGCQPTPIADPVQVNTKLCYYNLGQSMRWQLLKKNFYFFKNIHKGHTNIKLKFFFRKILKIPKRLFNL